MSAAAILLLLALKGRFALPPEPGPRVSRPVWVVVREPWRRGRPA